MSLLVTVTVAAYVYPMATDSSLDVLIAINQNERHAQLSHFDSLDTKAGLVLGFSGVIAALGTDSESAFGVIAILAAALAGTAAVGSSWPRRFPSIDIGRLGDYVGAEPSFTKLTLVDTFEVMNSEVSSLLELKSRRLKLALASLMTGVLTTAINLTGLRL